MREDFIIAFREIKLRIRLVHYFVDMFGTVQSFS